MRKRIASKRMMPCRRWWMAGALAAGPLMMAPPVMVCLAEQPELNSRMSPTRLPNTGVERGYESSVQACSAELSKNVDSWFAESTDAAASSDSGQLNGSDRWLRSVSSTSAAELARRMVEQANREFHLGAWLSAETSAWDALRWAAESVDLAAREQGATPAISALKNLHSAREAIREARDFAGAYGPLDQSAIQRMAVSHQTNLFDNAALIGLTATDASDRYLDHARVLLAPIARDSVEAARSMDLLAAVHLRREDAQSLSNATALCLRRAALQGQPGNASLAYRLGVHLSELGLLKEACWALEHSLSLQPDPSTAAALTRVLQRSGQADEAQRIVAEAQQQIDGASRLVAEPQPTSVGSNDRSTVRVPEIVELTPEEFAAISQPVNSFDQGERVPRATRPIPAITASATIAEPNASMRAPATSSAADVQEMSSEKPSWVRRVLHSWKRVW